MEKITFVNRPLKDLVVAGAPLVILFIVLVVVAWKYMDPAPPNHLVISTGEDQANLEAFADQYRDILKQDGVTLEIRKSEGPIDNLRKLQDPKSGVSVAFVEDGLGSPDAQTDVSSLGSLIYEPIWIFYHSTGKVYSHLSQLEGLKIASGRVGHGTHVIAERLLKLSGVDLARTQIFSIDPTHSASELQAGNVDAAIFLLPPEDPLIKTLLDDPNLKLMSLGQAEALTRKDASYHHLVLPHGAIDLKKDLPREDVNLVSSTLTLLVRDDLHPALAYLLLKAASQVHSGPGLLEKRGEFPSNKDDQFALSDDALQYYKSGGPFWQRYLPFWLAAWFDRFVFLVIPVLVTVLPLIRLIPRIYHWRIRSRIYQRYGELKFLETQIKPETAREDFEKFGRQLNEIEDRVNKMKIPLDFTEYIYSLRGHIHFVRERLEKLAGVNA